PSCRRGDFVTCDNEAITGVTRDGGYAQLLIVGAGLEEQAQLVPGRDGRPDDPARGTARDVEARGLHGRRGFGQSRGLRVSAGRSGRIDRGGGRGCESRSLNAL